MLLKHIVILCDFDYSIKVDLFKTEFGKIKLNINFLNLRKLLIILILKNTILRKNKINKLISKL